MSERVYSVYILASRSRTLYTGITNNLIRRMFEHRHKLVPGFTKQYRIDRLVYQEGLSDIGSAIRREKQIKGWLRAKKIALIESVNPTWIDLSETWFGSENARRSARKQRGPQSAMRGGKG